MSLQHSQSQAVKVIAAPTYSNLLSPRQERTGRSMPVIKITTMARELALINFELFSLIKPRDWILHFSRKARKAADAANPAPSSSTSETPTTPSPIDRFIEQFNLVRFPLLFFFFFLLLTFHLSGNQLGLQ